MAKFCPQCGKENRDEAAFCSSCGSPIAASDGQKPSKSSFDWGSLWLVLKDKYQTNKKSFIFAGICVLALVIVCIAVGTNGNSNAYVDWAKNITPIEGNYTTLDDALSYYLTSPRWNAHRSGDTAVVDILGSIRGASTTLRTTVEMQLNADGSDWETASFTSLEVGGRSLQNTSEMNESVRNIILAYDADWENLSPYVQAFSTNYGRWTSSTWDMAVHSQKAGAARYVIDEIGDSIYSGLSSLFQLADNETMTRAIDQTIDSIGSTYSSTAAGTTLSDMLDALRATLGFLGFLFSFA